MHLPPELVLILFMVAVVCLFWGTDKPVRCDYCPHCRYMEKGTEKEGEEHDHEDHSSPSDSGDVES